MKKSNYALTIFSTIFIIAIIALVWYLLFGEAFLRKLAAQSVEDTEEEVLLDISSVDDAYDAILNKSTKEFIGNHPIDEEFLSWFTGTYGIDALEEIAAYARLDNAVIWYDTTGCSIHVLWYNYCSTTGIQQYAIDKTFVMDTAQSDKTVLDFAGDFSLAEGVGTTTYYHIVSDDITACIGEDLRAEMSGADVMMLNNEFVYSTRGEALAGKDYTFRGNPEACTRLLELGVDAVGLANNHVYDFGEVGLLDTLSTLSSHNIPYIGAGNDIEEASEPIFFIANGRKIAVVAATQIERSTKYTKEATADSAGVLKTLDSDAYVAAIAKAKKNADYVICFVHWGTENTHSFGSDQLALARDFVAAGANAIIGAHPHCLQGVDMIEGAPVFYSLGNFYFSQETDLPSDYDTAMAQLIIDANGTMSARMLPCHYSEGVLDLVTDDSVYEQILSDVEAYSSGVTLDDEGYLVVH